MPDQVDIFLTFLSPRKKPKSRKFSKKVRSLNFKAKIFVTYQIMFSRIFVKNVKFRSKYRFKVLCMKKWPKHVTYPKYKKLNISLDVRVCTLATSKIFSDDFYQLVIPKIPFKNSQNFLAGISLPTSLCSDVMMTSSGQCVA